MVFVIAGGAGCRSFLLFQTSPAAPSGSTTACRWSPPWWLLVGSACTGSSGTTSPRRQLDPSLARAAGLGDRVSRARWNAIEAKVVRVENPTSIALYYLATARRLVPVGTVLEFSFHALAIHRDRIVILSVIGRPAPHTSSRRSSLKPTNRFIVTVAFRFVPLRIGVDEAGTADVRRRSWPLATATGVTLAIITYRDASWCGSQSAWCCWRQTRVVTANRSSGSQTSGSETSRQSRSWRGLPVAGDPRKDEELALRQSIPAEADRRRLYGGLPPRTLSLPDTPGLAGHRAPSSPTRLTEAAEGFKDVDRASDHDRPDPAARG